MKNELFGAICLKGNSGLQEAREASNCLARYPPRKNTEDDWGTTEQGNWGLVFMAPERDISTRG